MDSIYNKNKMHEKSRRKACRCKFPRGAPRRVLKRADLRTELMNEEIGKFDPLSDIGGTPNAGSE